LKKGEWADKGILRNFGEPR